MYRLPLFDAGYDVALLNMVLHYAESPESVLAAMAAIEDVVSQDALYPRTPIEPLGKGL